MIQINRGTGKRISKPKIQEDWKYDVIRNIRHLFKLKIEKQLKDDLIKNIRILFKLKQA